MKINAYLSQNTNQTMTSSSQNTMENGAYDKNKKFMVGSLIKISIYFHYKLNLWLIWLIILKKKLLNVLEAFLCVYVFIEHPTSWCM